MLQYYLFRNRGALSIFFRWGQLNNNDFTEVKSYISIVINNNGLNHFLSLYHKVTSLEGIENFIYDWSEFLKELDKIKETSPIADEAYNNAWLLYQKRIDKDWELLTAQVLRLCGCLILKKNGKAMRPRWFSSLHPSASLSLYKNLLHFIYGAQILTLLTGTVKEGHQFPEAVIADNQLDTVFS